MKIKSLLFALINFINIGLTNAQWTDKTMNFGGLTRSYRVYVSPNYSSSNPASLIIALHGWGDNMTDFSNTLNFSTIADTANIICIYPQAAIDIFVGSAWNASAGLLGYYPNGFVDDVGFLNAVIDTALVNYSIDHNNLYMCGFSLGGFMTQKMALLSNTRIAAFASISGTIGNGTTNFNPDRKIPIAHFHGVADSVVTYYNNPYGLDADSLINFWVANNTCSSNPEVYNYPDLANDGITIERFKYSGSTSQSDVWFYKMHGANHYVLSSPQNDISQAVEVWLFFRRYSRSSTGINSNDGLFRNITVYPNPANQKVSVIGLTRNEFKNIIINIYDTQGQLLIKQTFGQETAEVDISSLNGGIYLLKILKGNNLKVIKFIKE